MNRFTRACGSSRPLIALLGLVLALISIQSASADSSSPLLAAFYDRQMAIINGVAYGWKDDDTPKRVTNNAVQVGVGRSAFYVLNNSKSCTAMMMIFNNQTY